MLLANGLSLLFFLLAAFWILTIVVTGNRASPHISYGILSRDSPENTKKVGSSITTDSTTSWISPSRKFGFGFYHEKEGFSVGIQLFASASETVVVWTARPDLKRFTKDAFLNFTENGLFITPDKYGKDFPLFEFSSSAISAAMLETGNLVVFGNSTPPSGNSTLRSNFESFSAEGNPYVRSCSAEYFCRSGGEGSDDTIWRSFDFPTDTILGGQILPCGYNLTSSANETDHSIGNYTLNLPCHSANLISFRLNSTDKNWDTGFLGGDSKNLNLDENGRLYLNSYGDYAKDIFAYKPRTTNAEMIYRATLDYDGFFRLYALDLVTNLSTAVNEIPYYSDKCQYKEVCGVNSYCLLANSNAQCRCMPGFEYINSTSQLAGCRRSKTLPSCRMASAIISMEAVENIVGMDELVYDVVSTESKEDCSNACLSDCNCDAASFVDQNCLKLKLPLTSGRKDNNYKTVAFIKLASAESPQLAATVQQSRREIRFAAIFKSTAAVISIWIVVIGVFLSAYWFLFGKFRKEWREWELALTEEIAPRYFSYKELFKGSNEFKQQLGKGGHGTVFRAELLIGNVIVVVAVKKLHGEEIEGEREFQAEMRLIGRAYHVNLVRLIGFCHDGPSRLIVYELMSRGSLADHIFERRSRRPSWERRVEILLHAARGIHYLHCQCESKIIHRDIKPENILIAENWTTKIADFGIAKLLNKNQMRAATRTLAAGTEGYVAPECEEAADGTGEIEVTEKADVFSYGIVVLETICCKRNREVKASLCELVRKSYEKNELQMLVDGEQVEDFDLEKLVKIGLLCVQEDPNARPIMEDVVLMLEGYIDVPTLLPE